MPSAAGSPCWSSSSCSFPSGSCLGELHLLVLFTHSPPQAHPTHRISLTSSVCWILAIHNCRRRELDRKWSRVTSGPTPAPVSASSSDTLQSQNVLSKALCLVPLSSSQPVKAMKSHWGYSTFSISQVYWHLTEEFRRQYDFWVPTDVRPQSAVSTDFGTAIALEICLSYFLVHAPRSMNSLVILTGLSPTQKPPWAKLVILYKTQAKVYVSSQDHPSLNTVLKLCSQHSVRTMAAFQT